jgi:hypothetical protein
MPMPNRRPELTLPIADRRDRRSASPTASPEEAAAIVAALERFMRDTAPPLAQQADPPDPWRRAALLEGVGHLPEEPCSWLEGGGPSLPSERWGCGTQAGGQGPTSWAL